MPADTDIEVWGTVIDVLPGGAFKVKLDDNDNIVYAYLSGRMRLNSIKVVLRDYVLVALSPYDLSKGRLLKRAK
jgi:translation initiation factor IF-1